MPQVFVRYKRSRMGYKFLARLADELPNLIVDALDVETNPQARVLPEEVEVILQEAGILDKNIKDLGIVVHAHAFIERKATIEDRLSRLRQGIAGVIDQHCAGDSIKAYVWVQLVDGAFSDI